MREGAQTEQKSIRLHLTCQTQHLNKFYLQRLEVLLLLVAHLIVSRNQPHGHLAYQILGNDSQRPRFEPRDEKLERNEVLDELLWRVRVNKCPRSDNTRLEQIIPVDIAGLDDKEHLGSGGELSKICFCSRSLCINTTVIISESAAYDSLNSASRCTSVVGPIFFRIAATNPRSVSTWPSSDAISWAVSRTAGSSSWIKRMTIR